jgi:CheY-like chemotaxis protein
MPEAKILVAEDNPPSAELLHDHLESLGYRVELATDGQLAVEMALTGRFQLLILDVNMPGYDGVQVLQRLRQEEMAPPPKVIVVTADRLATRRDELTQLGVDGYMTKPVDLQRLTDEVKRVLAEAGASGG